MSRKEKRKRQRREARLSCHHRKCRSNGGETSYRNCVMIPVAKHRAFHLLFDNKEADEIARILNDIYIDPDWMFVVQRRE